MAIGSEQSLDAIPETAAVSHLSSSARSSPRSTSDSPTRHLQPISQHSRLLQPTLSWQAKAGWIAEPATASTAESAQSAAGVHTSTAASSARSQALAAGRRTSLIEPTSSLKERDTKMADAQEAAGDATMPISSAADHTDHSLAAQQKSNSLSGILHAELAKRGKAPAATWQQQRLQLRPVSQPSSPRSSRGGSPVGGQRYTEASVDTLLQQRAKLKHVQTSSKGLLPGNQSAAGPAVQQRRQDTHQPAAAQVAGAVKPPVSTTGARTTAQGVGARTTAQGVGARTTAQGVGAMQQPQKPTSMQPISSQTSQLRSKFGQLTDLLQNTALQRGISLSEVAVPATRKPSKDQPKRSSLDEIRTNFRSFTQGSSSGAEARNAPLRRVSTGAITPAFMKEKDRKDKALLESLGVADAAAGEEAPDWQASRPQPVASQPHESSASQQAQDGSHDRLSTSNISSSSQAQDASGFGHSTGMGSSSTAHQMAGSSSRDIAPSRSPIEMSDIHLSSTAAERTEQSAAALERIHVAQTVAAGDASKESAGSEDLGAASAMPTASAATAVGSDTHGADLQSRAAGGGAAHAQAQEGVSSAVSSRRPSWVTNSSYANADGEHAATNQQQSDTLSSSKEGSSKDAAMAQSISTLIVDATLEQQTAPRAADAQGKPDNAAGTATEQKHDVPLSTKRVGMWRKIFCCVSQAKQ